jgi:hypothetical protein
VNDVHNKRILRCTIINGSNAGEDISIPRIKLRPQDLTNHPCEWEWEILQFHGRLFYAMSLDKRQGQTLVKVGIWLFNAVFGHGQLYVASSITGVCSSVMFAVVPYMLGDPFITVNFCIQAHIGLYYFCITNTAHNITLCFTNMILIL